MMRINSDPAALSVRADAPYSTVRGFKDYAKAHPGEVTIGNSGPGTIWHITAGLAYDKTGVKVKRVPFDGAQPAVTAQVGGHIKDFAVSVAEVRGQVQANNLKILGVMSAERDKLFPDVPTFKELGVDVRFYTWRELGLPKGVPAEAKAKIADAYKEAFDSKEFKEFAVKASLNLSFQDSVAFTHFLQQNYSDV